MSAETWAEFRDSLGSAQDYLQHGYLEAGSPVPSNIPDLDSLLCGGFRPGLHVLGGEPGAGKSALGLFLSMMSALSGTRVMFASLEMSAGQCWDRCLSYASLKTGEPFGWGEVWRLGAEARERRAAAMKKGDAQGFVNEFMATDPIAVAATAFTERYPGMLITDAGSLHEISGLEEMARSGRRAGLNMLVVDYLQYMDVEGVTDEYARVSAVSKRLNTLGVSLGIPVLALSSVSRQGNAKAKVPDMHVFKGSGDIEFHALSAMVIDRDPEGLEDERRLHVVKARMGSLTGETGYIRLRFDGAHNSFELL